MAFINQQADPRVHTHYLHDHYQAYVRGQPTGTYFDLPNEDYRKAIDRDLHINVLDTRHLVPTRMLVPPNVPEGTDTFFSHIYD